MVSRKTVHILIVGIFCLSVLFSIGFSTIKGRALGYQTRDYPFFLQFYAKVFDHRAEPRFTLNPHGSNFLGYLGVEATDNFHRQLHFSPVSYAFGIIFALSKSPLLIFGAIAGVFFLPLLYLDLACGETGQRKNMALLLALLYAAYPSAFPAASYDLRPYILLGPLFACAMIAVHYQRPFLEQLLFFNLLFCVREEALILGAGILTYFVLRNYSEKRWVKRALILGLFWLTWALVIQKYYGWASFATMPGTNPVVLYVLEFVYVKTAQFKLFCISALICLVVVWYGMKREPLWFKKTFQVAGYLLVCLPLWWQLRYEIQEYIKAQQPDSVWAIFEHVVISPRFHLYFIVFFLLFILLWDFAGSRIYRTGLICMMLVCIVFSMVFHYSVPQATVKELLPHYNENQPTASIVFDVRKSTNKYRSHILCDYATYQAFFDYENVYVFDRLPWYIIEGEQRFYPDNKPVLEGLLRNKIEFIIVTKHTMLKIKPLLRSMSLKPQHAYGNDRFEIIRLPNQ